MKKINKKLLIENFILFILLPIFINLVLESFARKSFFGGFEKLLQDPFIFLCNTLIIASTLAVNILLRRYRYFGIAVISILWLLLGLTNFLLLCNRVLPFSAYDLQLITQLSSLTKKYLNPFTLALVSFLAVFVLIAVIILFFKARPPKQKHSYVHSAIFFIVITLLTFGSIRIAASNGIMQTQFPELPTAYLDNGFAYCFSLSLVDNGVDKVDGYSEELIDSITSSFDKTDDSTKKTPNVIFLQLESFFDVNTLKDVEFSKNPIPNLTKLIDENGSGLLTVPIIGAGTVNTEFEVVTGMRVTDFGAGEYPYKTILETNTAESIANNLKPHGYSAHFIHNYKGTFYGRDKVYSNLGYDYFIALESMTGYETNENGWAKDDVLLSYIARSLTSTETPDIITAIAVQAHGNYNVKENFKRHVTVTKCSDESLRTSYEYYVNQLYEVDKFVGNLINYLSKYSEDTILVAYGDHFPSFDLQNSDVDGRTIYQTDYFIWNNMGIEYEDKDIYSYQISSLILDSIGIRDGVINSCHQKYKDTDKYLYNLQALEYDTLYGEKFAFGGKDIYTATAMKHNSRKLEILNVKKKNGSDDTYIITGNGFTHLTFVRVGNVLMVTRFINDHTLEFKWESPSGTIPISVWEKNVGNSDHYFMK